MAAEFVSSRTGLASVAVSSKSKQLGTWRISNYTPEFRETSGVGKRPVLTPDEVLRLPIDKALAIIRGKKTLKVDKMDYSKHPDYPLLRSCKASAHVPEWRRMEMEAEGKKGKVWEAETQKTEARKTQAQKRTETQKTEAQKSAETQKSTAPQRDKRQNAKEEKTGTRKVEAGKTLPKGGAEATPQNPGKAAKAAPRTASEATSKAPARNAAEQTAEKKTPMDAVAESTIPKGTVSGKVNRTTGKPKPKTEPDANTGEAKPAEVVLTDKDSIMS